MAPRRPRNRGKSKTCAEQPHGCEIAELFHILGKTHMLDLLHVFIFGASEGGTEPRRSRGYDAPGPHRFVDLQEKLSISPNTLSDRLKELVKAGLVTRKSYNEIPPRVDYEPTAKALGLLPVFESLTAWAARNDLKPAAPALAGRAGAAAP